jgi:hypothetical protein
MLEFRSLTIALLASLLLLPLAAPADPLPSWRDGANKTAVLEFIGEVTAPGGRRYVRPAERIAVFTHEGVLLPEQPQVQGLFTLQRLRAQRERHPEWETLMPFRGALALNGKFFLESDERTALTVIAATHSGLTQQEYRREVREFWGRARHPQLNAGWSRTGYQPMQELLALLRMQGFRTFIITAGDVDFVRAIAEDMYSVPPEQVIGTGIPLRPAGGNGRLDMRRTPGEFTLVDGAEKALAVERHIGRRPLLAAGRVRNGGDIDLLRYTQDPTRPALQLLVVHDDWEREFAYHEEDRASLTAAEAGGWRVISMRWDWRRIFAFEELAEPAG